MAGHHLPARARTPYLDRSEPVSLRRTQRTGIDVWPDSGYDVEENSVPNTFSSRPSATNPRSFKYQPTQPPTVLKIMTLYLALATIALSGTRYAAKAGQIPPSLRQVQDKTSMNDTMCDNIYMLMQALSGIPAYVFTEHACALEGRG